MLKSEHNSPISAPLNQFGKLARFFEASFIYQQYEPSIGFQWVAEILTLSIQCIWTVAEHKRFDGVLKE